MGFEEKIMNLIALMAALIIAIGVYDVFVNTDDEDEFDKDEWDDTK